MIYNERRIVSILRQQGYKLTDQRRAVLSVIVSNQGHLTPAALYDRVKRRCPGIGLVTIYRTLELLAKLGFICQVHSGDNGRSYLLRRPAGHHHHIICSSCDKVVDFTDCDLSQMMARVSYETGFEIDSHLVELIGRCRECRQKI